MGVSIDVTFLTTIQWRLVGDGYSAQAPQNSFFVEDWSWRRFLFHVKSRKGTAKLSWLLLAAGGRFQAPRLRPLILAFLPRHPPTRSELRFHLSSAPDSTYL